MGWFWGKSTPTEGQPEKALQDAAPPPRPDDPSTTQEPPTKRALTRDEQAEAELQSLIHAFQASPPTTQAPLSDSSWPPTSRINTSSSIAPAALYPSSMSCSAAFDSAFYCQSLGGQWTNVYRYGGLRDCRESWRDFWFCMRTNRGSMNDERRMERIREHHRAKDRKYRTGRSSEDVWEMREQALEGALEGDLDAALRREEEEQERGRREV